MRPQKTVVLGDNDKEIRDFLQLARAHGSLRVEIDGDVLVVKVGSERVSDGGRDFLTKKQ